MKRLACILTAAGAVVATTLLPPLSAAAQDTGTVYLVHGIPDLPADIAVDGTVLLDDLAPESARGPLELPAGDHQVVITAAATGTELLSATATVPAGGNITLVAHLSEAGAPTLSTFDNDVSPIPPGRARMIVRHVAAAPPVDVRTDGAAGLTDLRNGQGGTLDVPAGPFAADVLIPGSETVLIEPWALELAEGSTTVVQAVGTGEDLGAVIFVLAGMSSAPGGVPAGGGPAALVPTAAVVIAFVLGTGLVLGSLVRGRRVADPGR